MKKVLVTGTSGFIGFYLVKLLVKRGFEVIGLDNINNYYEIQLKYDRLIESGIDPRSIEYNRLIKSTKIDSYSFIKIELDDKDSINNLFKDNKFDIVINLAAQAGVRYSLENPYAYVDSNITGFLNILEACRHYGPEFLLYASSSSVYGLNKEIPFTESDRVDTPISLYAASKRANELFAHTYSHLFDIKTIGLRFFTVYGPWGRPDMALFMFTKNILEGKPIRVFNNGNMKRDFTYVDDIVEGVVRLTENFEKISKKNKWQVFNIGNSQPVELMDFVRAIEKKIGKEAIINFEPLQPGDVERTFADTSKLKELVDYKPNTPIEFGVGKFIDWYKNYYNV